jgi:membrane protease YdiL (CAAX protease family)
MSIYLGRVIKGLSKSPLIIFKSKRIVLFIAIVEILLSYFIAGQKIIYDLSIVKIIPMIIALLLGGLVVFINVQITGFFKKKLGTKYPTGGNVRARIRHKMIMQKGRIWILYIIAICCLEEVIFRYFIINKLISLSFSIITACLISSIFFAILHLQTRKLLEYFFLGIVFATIFVLTDNIIYSIVAHFVNNIIIYIIKCKIMSREDAALIK